jgi:hypothetical protein
MLVQRPLDTAMAALDVTVFLRRLAVRNPAPAVMAEQPQMTSVCVRTFDWLTVCTRRGRGVVGLMILGT